MVYITCYEINQFYDSRSFVLFFHWDNSALMFKRCKLLQYVCQSKIFICRFGQELTLGMM